MDIKVGSKYQWDMADDTTTFVIDRIEDGMAYYHYPSDGVQSTAVVNSDWFDEVTLISDLVDSSTITPSHYNDSKIDALAVIDDWKLDFRLGNTIKYIKRHEKKGKPLEDLKKAAQYLALKIKQLEDEQSK